MWFPACPLSEVNLYSSQPSGADSLSAVLRLEVSVSRRLEIHYILYGWIDQCHSVCPLYGGCPHFGGSVNRGSIVAVNYVACLNMYVRIWCAVYAKSRKNRHICFSQVDLQTSPLVCRKSYKSQRRIYKSCSEYTNPAPDL